MGLITGLLGLPLAPVRGVVWLAEQIRDTAESRYYDPVAIRAQLERIDDARRRGELSEQECTELENELLQRLMTRRPTSTGMDSDG
jgi:Gas vesicle protein G